MIQPTEQKYLSKLIGVVEENLADSCFGGPGLAREMGVSLSTLQRRLRAISQQSISQFIRETRLKRAMHLLQLQAGTVSEIAYGVGFGSTTYFSKCFHDFYGYPPSSVKKRFGPRLENDQKKDKQQRMNVCAQSVAVLPFDNFTGDEKQDFLVFGVHDALIGELGELKALRVVSKTSVYAYLDNDKTITRIADELDVDVLVEGSALLMDGKIKIQLKLYKVHPQEELLMTQLFDVDMSNILTLYSEAVRKIAGEIQLTMSSGIEIHASPRKEVNPDSYKAFLRGKYHLYSLTEEGVKKGLEYLHEAIRLEPANPFAYAALALGYMEIAHGPLNPGDACVKAEWAAREALKLGPELAETQLALAEICIYSTWEFDKGEAYFRRALEINPNLSLAHYHYSWLLFLLGRNEEAVLEHELAQKYDPFNPMITAFTGALYGYLGREEDALREAAKAFEIQQDCPDAYFVLGETYLAMGRKEEAITAHHTLAEVSPVWAWCKGYMLAVTGHTDEARQILKQVLGDQMTSWQALGIAVIYGALGEFDRAWEWIAYKPAHAWIPWIAVMPMWNPLRKDPRFEHFVTSLKLSCVR